MVAITWRTGISCNISDIQNESNCLIVIFRQDELVISASFSGNPNLRKGFPDSLQVTRFNL